MFLQEITPDTSFYMLLGYAAFAILGGGYVVSVLARSRNLRREAETIARIQVEDTDQSLS